jgi:hypothetical protein
LKEDTHFYPDTSRQGAFVINELARTQALKRATARASKLPKNIRGVRYYLKFCSRINSPDLYRGVFVKHDPYGRAVNQLFESFVIWLTSGGHEDEINPATGIEESSPIMPSTIMAIYSSALILNKLFGRPVVGLNALRLVQAHANLHIPEAKVYLSKANFELLLRKCAEKFKGISSRTHDREQKYFVSGYLTLALMVFPLYRVTNILRNASKDDAGFTTKSFSFITQNSEKLLKIVLFEKTDKAKKRSAPKRTILWPKTPESEVKLGNIGVYEIVERYLKIFNINLKGPELPIQKPKALKAKAYNSVYLTSAFRKFLSQLPDFLGITLDSLPSVDSIPTKLGPRIIRRSAISWHADVSPMHIVQRMAGHAHISTTQGIYAGAAADELLILQAGHQRRLMLTEKCFI